MSDYDGIGWFTRAHCHTADGLEHAGPPRYFETEAAARADMRDGRRRWPDGAEMRQVDLFRQRWTEKDGERIFGGPGMLIEEWLLDGVPGLAPGRYGHLKIPEPPGYAPAVQEALSELTEKMSP